MVVVVGRCAHDFWRSCLKPRTHIRCGISFVSFRFFFSSRASRDTPHAAAAHGDASTRKQFIADIIKICVDDVDAGCRALLRRRLSSKSTTREAHGSDANIRKKKTQTRNAHNIYKNPRTRDATTTTTCDH